MTKIIEDLILHPFQECPKCKRLIHKTVTMHCCIDDVIENLHDEPETGEAFTAPTPAQQLDGVSDAKIDEITVCSYCDKETKWSNGIPRNQWLCSHCGKLNNSDDPGARESCSDGGCMPTTRSPDVLDVIIDPIYRVDRSINLKGLLPAKPGKFIGMNEIKIYLSGPMANLPDLNHSEFEKYATKYRELGFTVYSPHEMYSGKDPHEGMRSDLQLLASGEIERIYLLPGWENGSRGVALERHVAEYFNIPVWFAETNEPFHETITEEAQRVVYGSRRKTYGGALDNFDLTAKMVSATFSAKLKEPFTAEDIALFMMVFKISRLVLSPNHRDSVVDVSGYGLCYWDVGNDRKMLQLPAEENPSE